MDELFASRCLRLPNPRSTLVGMPSRSRLYYGDNLQVLREHLTDESVDLIYLDPPFNSNRSYNVLFKTHSGIEAQAQIEAFDDTWQWSQQSEELYASMISGGAPLRVSEAIEAMHGLLGPNDVLAYLVMMSARLVELHRVLKPTGSLYLHCDPTASHYLKVIMDAVFGPERFLNEITWMRTFSHGNVGRNFGKVTDIILVYTKSKEYTWNQQYEEYSTEYVEKYFRYYEPDGRRYRTVSLRNPSPRPNLRFPFTASNGVTYQPHPNGWSCNEVRLRLYDAEGRLYFPSKADGALLVKQYLNDKQGVKLQNLWTDIAPIGAHAAERLGYPTQKPIALLERIIATSSNEGQVVLDPFCGCGTAVDAAQALNRNWIGIDVTYLAIDLIQKRLMHSYGPSIENDYSVRGIPTDVQGAEALFHQNPFDFERWAVSLVNGEPNQKQIGDKGIDGRIRFQSGKSEYGTVIVSVKGGLQLNPAMVRDLVGTVQRTKAEMGLLITLSSPTKGMIDEANHSGIYTNEFTGNSFPKVQILTIQELMNGKKPDMQTAILPYIKAAPRPVKADSLF